MKIKFPFLYQVKIRTPRYRATNTKNILAWEWFDIKEIELDQAPLVITGQTIGFDDPLSVPTQTLYRRWNNKLISEPYLKTSVKEDGQWIKKPNNPDNFKQENFQLFLNRWAESCLDDTNRSKRTQVFPLDNRTYISNSSFVHPNENILNRKKVEKSDKQEVWEQIASFLSHSAFVNKQFYRASEGPGYLIYPHHNQQDNNLQANANFITLQTLIVVKELGDINPSYRQLTFPTDQQKQATVYFENIITNEDKEFRKNWQPTIENTNTYPDRIGSVKFHRKLSQSTYERIINSANQLIKLMEPNLGKMNKDLILKYAHLREDLKTTRASFGNKFLSTILTRTIDLHTLWKNNYPTKQIYLKDRLQEELNILSSPEPKFVFKHSDPDTLDITNDDLKDLGLNL